ncbi:hypothetical protein FPZ12_005155 [Amycolatopsis acidicola]|uniref:YbaB/EbfC family nucleoid-associated protein n=1 Tax=Amycolatopsis acidicola TaxID=2596893 RepID=A0A5N0VHZ5_9PSEU|nr:hypothetical protein [Amycolatopsis acidicola]KAA9165866.1 hypothetical protein FPZ12_005155 [Amycolatopsis acidicola]
MRDTDDEFSERLAGQRRLLASIRAGNDEDEEDEDTPAANVQTTGWSAGRLVKAVVRDHRLAELSLDDSVPGRPADEVGELIAAAANSALADFRDQVPSATDPLPDLATMSTEFRAAAEQGGQLMKLIGSALGDTMAKVGERTGMRGDPSPHGMESLFGDALNLLRSAQESLAGFQGAQVTGEGSDADEEVFATVGPDGLVSIDELSDVARSLSGEDLCELVLQAVNEALADWEDQREDGLPSADDADADALRELSDRAMELSEHSMRQLSGYTDNLSAIMRSIGEP